jgi:hypothetical protein
LLVAFAMLEKMHGKTRRRLPANGGDTPDKKLRRLDCAVLNLYLRHLQENEGIVYDTVRCGFVEGPPAFKGSGIMHQSHVQLAVRTPACIVGVFRPTMNG